MSPSRISAFAFLAILLTFAAISAQPGLPPGVKVPPQIKPGVPPVVPKAPIPGPGDPKGKNPLPIPPGMNPGGVPAIPGIPTGPGAAPPPEKKDNINWPKEVNGKNVETIVKEMRTHSDPAYREAAIRALPLFGPKGREAGADALVEAMSNKESDINVRLAAVGVAPAVLLGLAKAPDAALNNGLGLIVGMLTHEMLNVRFEAVLAAGNVGPYLRTVQPSAVDKLKTNARMGSSWHMRRAAVAALGSVGQGIQTGEGPDDKSPPDTVTVASLLDILKVDNCAAVRKESVNALIALGPVAASQQKAWRAALDYVLNKSNEKDKSVLLWVHVLIIRNDPNGLKGNELHLDAIAKVLGAPEPVGRLEACQALGVLGEDAVTKLQDLIDIINKEKEVLVVAAAIIAVTAMPSKDAVTVPILKNVKATHPNEDIKKVASEAIDVLEGRKKKK